MIEKYIQCLKLDQKSDKTIESYLKRIKPYLKFCKNKPSKETLDNFILQKRENNASVNSINGFITAMKSFSKYHNLELEFPKQKLQKRKVHRYWTEKQFKEEIICMLNLIFSDGQEIEDLLKFGFYTGLRPEELLNLNKSDIDFEKKDIIVKNGKGNKDRIIPFSNEKLKFNKWIENFLQSQSNGKIFHITYQTLGNKFKKIETELNLDYHITPYFMRRSFAKYMLSKGLDIAHIQRLLGHENISTTMIYVQPDDQMMKEAYEKLEEV